MVGIFNTVVGSCPLKLMKVNDRCMLILDDLFVLFVVFAFLEISSPYVCVIQTWTLSCSLLDSYLWQILIELPALTLSHVENVFDFAILENGKN